MNWILVFGALASQGLGEKPFAPSVELRVVSSHFEASGEFELSKKLESNAGWIGSTRLTYTQSIFRVGVAGVYREAGTWAKKTGWVEAGLAIGPVTIDFRKAILGTTKEEAGVRTAVRLHKNLEWEVQLLKHAQGLGKTSSISILIP